MKSQSMPKVMIVGPDSINLFASADEAGVFMWGKSQEDYVTFLPAGPLPYDVTKFQAEIDRRLALTELKWCGELRVLKEVE